MTVVAGYNTELIYYDEGNLSEQSRSDREHLIEELRKVVEQSADLTGIELAEAEDRITELVYALRWQGANPKEVPFEDYVDLIRGRRPNRTRPENDAAKRIRNRATAIRAYCISCMCGDTALVRNCTSFTCPLHPFRLGGDPFRGYKPPPVLIDVAPDDDDSGIFEDGDD